MKKKENLWTIFAGILIGGLTYWTVPYSEISMIDLHFWLLIGTGSIIGASLSTIFFQKKPIDSGLLITFGVVLSVIFRIIFDVFYLDASSHSLAGIEIMIAGLQSLPPSLVGAYAAIILKKNPGDVQ